MMAAKTRVAVVRRVSASLPAAALRQSADAPLVDLARAHTQHAAYVEALKRVGVDVVVAGGGTAEEDDDMYPDAVFVEDTAVCIDGIALATRPGHPSRRGEVKAVAQALRDAGVHVIAFEDVAGPETADSEALATLDGGDVLWTGSEIFVGRSKRTNDGGIAALAKAFAPRRVVAVDVAQGLHLKSLCSLAKPGVIAIGPTDASKAVQAAIEAASPGHYQFLGMPTELAANCVFVNGHVLHAPGARDAMATLTGITPIELPNDELAKVDGALTCCSVLVP